MKTHLIREVATVYTGNARPCPVEPLRDPAGVVEYLRPLIDDEPKEKFAAVLLDGRHRSIGTQIVSVGTLTASLVHPREVFRAAIAKSAAAIILAHNHPSGDPKPSTEDLEITDRLMRAGTIVGIPILDHIIIGPHAWNSAQAEGWLKPEDMKESYK